MILPNVLFPVLGGLIVGFVAGVLATLDWIGRRREQGKPVPTYKTDDPQAAHRKRPWRGNEHLSWVGVALLILSLAGLVAGTVSILQNNDTAACLRDYIEQTSATNQERGGAADLDRQAVRQQRAVTREFNQVMIDAVTHPVTDPAAMAKARADFLVKARDWDARLAEVDRLDRDADTRRRNNPLPPPPNC